MFAQEHLTRGGDTSSPWRSIELRLSLNDETAIAPTLAHLNADMHDLLQVGSYPVTDQACMHGGWKVMEQLSPELCRRYKNTTIAPTLPRLDAVLHDLLRVSSNPMTDQVGFYSLHLHPRLLRCGY